MFATNAARALFAYLAVEFGRSHAREQLAGLLWPNQTSGASSASLRTTLSRLRKAIPDPPGAASVLEVTKLTLRFKPEAATSDVTTFERLLAECGQHAQAHGPMGACPECIGRMEQAAALYRGDFLNSLFLQDSQSFEEWVLFKREQLRWQALTVMDTLARHYEAGADFRRVRDTAARQLALDPWREEAHAQMMRALSGLGDRRAALTHYEACCRSFQRELGVAPGVAPGAEIHALAERIRAGEPTGQQRIGPPAHRHNLPEQLTPFVGRERELATIVSKLHEPHARLITLVGPGGIGKTRLIIEAALTILRRERAQPNTSMPNPMTAHRVFPDGIWFVPLANVPANEADMLQALAEAVAQPLGLAAPPKGGMVAHLLEHARTRVQLLVLDNVEHLLQDGVHAQVMSQFVTALLRAAPGMQLLVTSREALRIEAEHVIRLHGLPVPNAQDVAAADASSLRLFVQRAQRALPAFALSPASLPWVIEICRLLDGMPLGIELAASLTPHFECHEIAQAIRGNLDVLASNRRDIAERHRSLRAVFEHSWRMLSAGEQRTLAQMSIFTGSVGRSTALAVTEAKLAQLASLVEKSLLRLPAVGRYEMHELVSLFAAEKLAAFEPELANAVQTRYVAHYLAFVGARADALLGPKSAAVVAEVRREYDNIQRAWQLALAALQAIQPPARVDPALMIGAIHGLNCYWKATGRFADGEAALLAAIDALTPGIRTGQERAQSSPHLSQLLIELTLAYSDCLYGQNKPTLAMRAAERAVAEAGQARDHRSRAHGLLAVAHSTDDEPSHAPVTSTG